jgi:hypothetical protein
MDENGTLLVNAPASKSICGHDFSTSSILLTTPACQYESESHQSTKVSSNGKRSRRSSRVRQRWFRAATIGRRVGREEDFRQASTVRQNRSHRLGRDAPSRRQRNDKADSGLGDGLDILQSSFGGGLEHGAAFPAGLCALDGLSAHSATVEHLQYHTLCCVRSLRSRLGPLTSSTCCAV